MSNEQDTVEVNVQISAEGSHHILITADHHPPCFIPEWAMETARGLLNQMAAGEAPEATEGD